MFKPRHLVTALGFALPALAMPTFAQAQSNADLLKELQALKARITQLESQMAEQAAKPTVDPAEFNRIAVKTEAMEDAQEVMGFKGLKVSGYMDPTYIYNRNQDRAGFQFLNRVDDDGYNYDNSYFGAVVIDFLKETEGGTRWHLTLAPNRGVGAVFNGTSIVQEATVSIPLSDLQTRLIAGQMPDWSGYEYLPATQNKLITHNLLFDFTLPTAYTGAGLELTRDKWIIKTMLANMNASKRASDQKAPVLAYRVDYAKGEFEGFGFAGVHGKAANFSTAQIDPVTGEAIEQADSMLHLFEIDGYFIRGDWTVQGQASFGTQKRASISPDPETGDLRDSRWWGLSGLVAYKFTPRFEGTARADYLNNRKNGGGLLGYVAADGRNGIGPDPAGDPNVGTNRYALTFGLSYLFNRATTFKAEYRYDRASLPVFEDVTDGSFKKSNHLLGFSTVVAF